MNESIKVESILKEIAHVLKKHSVPFSTIFIDISLPDSDFDNTFPHLKDYKAGVFYRSFAIDNIPVTFRAKRRIPFEEITQWLAQNTLPVLKKAAAEIEHDFDDVGAKVQVSTSINNPKFPHNSYQIDIECRRKEEPKIEEGNTVILSVIAQQRDATSYPTINSFVGWLVDEESGGDFGLDIVARGTFPQQEIHAGTLEQIKSSFPNLGKQLKIETKKLHKT